MTKWGHTRFIKEYENSCKILELDDKKIMITLNDYKKMKKITCDRWVVELRRQGFKDIGEFKGKFLNQD